MKVISSQRYINEKILRDKIVSLAAEKPDEVVLLVYPVGFGGLYFLDDGHHTLKAARQLNIPVVFEIAENQTNLTGYELLEESRIDSDWYDLETGQNVF